MATKRRSIVSLSILAAATALFAVHPVSHAADEFQAREAVKKPASVPQKTGPVKIQDGATQKPGKATTALPKKERAEPAGAAAKKPVKATTALPKKERAEPAGAAAKKPVKATTAPPKKERAEPAGGVAKKPAKPMPSPAKQGRVTAK